MLAFLLVAFSPVGPRLVFSQLQRQAPPLAPHEARPLERLLSALHAGERWGGGGAGWEKLVEWPFNLLSRACPLVLLRFGVAAARGSRVLNVAAILFAAPCAAICWQYQVLTQRVR